MTICLQYIEFICIKHEVHVIGSLQTGQSKVFDFNIKILPIMCVHVLAFTSVSMVTVNRSLIDRAPVGGINPSQSKMAPAFNER